MTKQTESKKQATQRREAMLGKKVARGVAVGIAVFAIGGGLAACGSDNNNDKSSSSGGGGSSGKSAKIALLLPETKTARYESQDRPNFERKVKELCSNCEIVYSNADQDPAKQLSQVEAAITKQVDVMVLDPVDSASAAGMVAKAKAANIPVISYDRLITDAPALDYYISFDNVKVGQLQGQALSDKLGGKGTIFMINGSPTDNNAKLFKQGAHSVLDKSGIKVAKEFDTPDWSPDKAQSEADQAITALGKDGFQGVYAANDGTAGGAIASMKSAGVDPKTRPTTGQDAELAAIQRILAGDQYMTVYKAIIPEAEAAATLAVALGRGEQPPANVINGKTDNNKKQVPSVLLTPVAVTADKVESTIVKDGFWKVPEICTGEFKAACDKNGIK
jgi:D-xylose transport system substrate-binding protein